MNYMQIAIEEAKKAFEENEVPIGAVIVSGGQIIARAHNRCEGGKKPVLHAEMIAIAEACEKLGTKSLDNCELYVTVEPCPMCSGAIGLSRIKRVYIGCEEPKTGAMGSKINISQHMPWNTEVYFGFCEEECKSIMKKFFENKR